MAVAAEFNFAIDAGADATQTFTSTFDLTGYTARCQLRPTLGSAVALELTTGNGKITLVGTTITLIFSNSDTSALTLPAYLYDVEVVSGSSVVTRVVKGTITVYPEVTR